VQPTSQMAHNKAAIRQLFNDISLKGNHPIG